MPASAALIARASSTMLRVLPSLSRSWIKRRAARDHQARQIGEREAVRRARDRPGHRGEGRPSSHPRPSRSACAVESIERIEHRRRKAARPRAIAPPPLRPRRRSTTAPTPSPPTRRSRPQETPPTSAEPAQPMAVTRPISGWPFSIVVSRAPSVIRSIVPVSADHRTACRAHSARARRRPAAASGERRELRAVEPHRRAGSAPASDFA